MTADRLAGVTSIHPGADAASGRGPEATETVSPATLGGVYAPGDPGWLQREWDLPALAAMLCRRWRLIVAAVAFGLLLAALLLAQWPRAYTAEAVVLLDPESQPRVEFEGLLTGAALDDQRLSSEVLVLRAPTLAARVIRQLNLASHPDFNPDLPQRLPPYAVWRAIPSGWRAAVKGWLGLAEPQPPAAPEARLEGQAARVLAAFADRLAVERIGRSLAVRVAVTSHDPDLAAAAANAVADRYLEEQLEAKRSATAFAESWLDRRVADLRSKVETAERAVEEYRIASGLIDANGSTIIAQQLAELNTRLIAARGETAAARARLTQVQGQLRVPGEGLAAAEVLSSPLIHRLKEQEAEVRRQRAELAQEYGPKHPRMLSIEAELGDIQTKIAAEIRQIVAGLRNAVSVAAAQEAALAAALQRAEAEAADQGKAQVRLNALEREAEASRTLLATFLQRNKQAADQQAIQRPDARILARAMPPEDASQPRYALVLGGSGALSLLAGLAVALVLGLRKRGLGMRGFDSPAALRSRLRLPVLGWLPQDRSRRGQGPADAVADRPLGGFAESLRMVAAGLGGARTILVTGAMEGEGKTTLALGLARTLAAAGGRVLLVDADLRRAGLSYQCGLERMPGLADALAVSGEGGVPLAADRVRGLQIAPAGSPDARLLVAGQSTARLAPILQDWQTRFDHLILDAAPVLQVAEVAQQARLADATLLAVRWRTTPAETAAEAAERLRAAGAALAGCVLTRMEAEQLAASYGYAESGAYGAARRRSGLWRRGDGRTG